MRTGNLNRSHRRVKNRSGARRGERNDLRAPLYSFLARAPHRPREDTGRR